jgi:hypothetical protein
MSIHGYKSKGKWQDSLTQCINGANLISAPYKYGYKILRILPNHIKNDVIRFRDWYFSITDDSSYDLNISEPFHRPSIIAHSLGTWILAQSLLKYSEIKFDKIFLFGSIIPEDFDWFKLILGDQVNSVIYERAKKDKIVPFGFIFTGSLKPCGTKGFIQKSSFLKEEIFSLFGHNDFNYKAHFKEYIIKRLRETPHQLSIIPGRKLTEKEVIKIFKETGEIDELIYPPEYTQDEISMNKALEWFRIEKDIWSFVINSYNKSALGYINAIPVKEATYKLFCSGELLEKDINASEIQDYDTASSYNLIILSIAIKKSIINEETMITKGRIAEMLIMSFIYKINQHNDVGKKNKLSKMAAFAWTSQGKKLCEGFCMTEAPSKDPNFPLYELDFSKLTMDKINEANFMSKWWYTQLIKIKN